MGQLDEKVALMRAAVVAWAVRSVRVEVGGGRGEIDREGATDNQKKGFGKRPKVLTWVLPPPCVKITRSNRGAQKGGKD
jgi:hypothetical protein